VPPEAQKALLKIEGRWEVFDGGVIHIEGETVRFAQGEACIAHEGLASFCISTTFPDGSVECLKGTLADDGYMLVWDDGDIWTRRSDASPSKVSPAPVKSMANASMAPLPPRDEQVSAEAAPGGSLNLKTSEDDAEFVDDGEDPELNLFETDFEKVDCWQFKEGDFVRVMEPIVIEECELSHDPCPRCGKWFPWPPDTVQQGSCQCKEKDIQRVESQPVRGTILANAVALVCHVGPDRVVLSFGEDRRNDNSYDATAAAEIRTSGPYPSTCQTLTLKDAAKLNKISNS